MSFDKEGGCAIRYGS